MDVMRDAQYSPPRSCCPKTVENGLPGGSEYLCIINATSVNGQGCDEFSLNAMNTLMVMSAGANRTESQCVDVMYGVCMQFDFVDIGKVGSKESIPFQTPLRLPLCEEGSGPGMQQGYWKSLMHGQV